MRVRDEKHLQFLRTLPCLICLNNIETEACHIRMSDARIGKKNPGIGSKPDDRFCLPLCGKHHRQQHAEGDEKRFWGNHKIDAILVALALYSVSGDAEEAEKVIHASQEHLS